MLRLEYSKCFLQQNNFHLTPVITLLASLFLISKEDQDVFEDGCKVHEQGEGMPDVIPVSHAEFLHDEMSVIQDEGRHNKKSNNQLHVCNVVRSNEDVQN